MVNLTEIGLDRLYSHQTRISLSPLSPSMGNIFLDPLMQILNVMKTNPNNTWDWKSQITSSIKFAFLNVKMYNLYIQTVFKFYKHGLISYCSRWYFIKHEFNRRYRERKITGQVYLGYMKIKRKMKYYVLIFFLSDAMIWQTNIIISIESSLNLVLYVVSFIITSVNLTFNCKPIFSFLLLLSNWTITFHGHEAWIYLLLRDNSMFLKLK